MRSNSENGSFEVGDDGEMAIGVDGHGEVRVRDMRKKMKVPFFGLVYKRQMAVNAIMIVLITAYITLICLA